MSDPRPYYNDHLDFETLEDARSYVAGEAGEERDAKFNQGDGINKARQIAADEAERRAIEQAERTRTRHHLDGERVALIRQKAAGDVTVVFAEDLKCTRRWPQILARVARFFAPDLRYDDHAWELYRACADVGGAQARRDHDGMNGDGLEGKAILYSRWWLTTALDKQWLASHVRKAWREAQGETDADPLFRRFRCELIVDYDAVQGVTFYSFTEEGAPRVGMERQSLPVRVTVSEVITANERSPEETTP